MATIESHSYDADNRSNSPFRFVGEMLRYPAKIRTHRALVWNFYKREFYGRFRGSFLGMFWVLVHPIFLFAIYYVVFGVLFKARSANGAPPMHYSMFLFVGIIAWTAFIETVLRGITLVVENGNLIQKVSFPAELLPLHLVTVNLIVYGVGVLVYLAIAALTSFALPGWNLLGLPFVIAVQAVFSLGFTLLLAACYVFVRDILQVFPILAQFWFFATPVFWLPQMLEGNASLAPLASAMNWNPMYLILSGHRAALGATHHFVQDSTFWDVLRFAGLAAIPAFLTFMLGYSVFRSLQHRFADEV